MRVVLPTIEFQKPGENLAPRPATLDGKVIGFIDGWPERQPDGTSAMYPLMREILKVLQERFDLAGYVWEKKPNISKPVPVEQLESFLSRVDVVVNGECA